MCGLLLLPFFVGAAPGIGAKKKKEKYEEAVGKWRVNSKSETGEETIPLLRYAFFLLSYNAARKWNKIFRSSRPKRKKEGSHFQVNQEWKQKKECSGMPRFTSSTYGLLLFCRLGRRGP